MHGDAFLSIVYLYSTLTASDAIQVDAEEIFISTFMKINYDVAHHVTKGNATCLCS